MNLDTLPSGRRSLRARIQTLFAGKNPLPLALLYLAALTLAELLTVFFLVQVGFLLHLPLLFLIMLHAAARWHRPRPGNPACRFLLALTLVPLIRVVSLSLPLAGFPLVYWYLITSLPLFVAALVVMRLLDLPWRDLGLSARGVPGWLLQLLVGLTGIALGLVEYFVLRPEPLIRTFTLQALWLPALILLLSTGYLEELIFRRIMQRAAIEQLGRRLGIFYVALLFAVLHAGYKSLPDVLFVFAVGLAFGCIVHRTGSLVGVSLSHGLTNVVLFLVAPFWLAGPQTPPLPGFNAPSSGPAVVATAPETKKPCPGEHGAAYDLFSNGPSAKHAGHPHHGDKGKAEQQRDDSHVQHTAQRPCPLSPGCRQDLLLDQEYQQRHHGQQAQRRRQRRTSYRRHRRRRYRGNHKNASA
jgi:membrane protease YdiL (CAAX protease family)